MISPATLAETRLQLALDAGSMGTWTSDLATGAQVWDQREFELLGVPPDVPPPGDLFRSLVLPEDLPNVEWQAADLRRGPKHVTQLRFRRPEARIRCLPAAG